MAYDGSLKFDTKIDQSGFESGLKKLGGFVKKSAQVAAAAVTTATTALSGFAAAGVKYNAQLETYNQTLTTLLGSESKAQKAFEQIKKDAARTPFDVASLTQANSMLISTGMNAEDSRKDVMNLANAVAATGGGSDELSRMAQNMQQIKNLGKASAVDIKQFAMAGINIYGILADYLGITADEAAKLDVTYEQLSGALEYAASAQGKYTGALEKQSQTVKGQLSTLKDNAMSFLGDITKGMSVSLKDEAIPLINGYMDRLKEAFSRDGLNGLVSEFGDVLGDLVGKVAEQAPKVVEQGVNLIKSFAGGIVKNKDKLISAAKEIVKTIVDALISLLPKEVQKPVKDALQAIAKAFNSNDLKTAIKALSDLFTSLIKTAANLAKTVLPPLVKVLGFLLRNTKLLVPVVLALLAAKKAYSLVAKAEAIYEKAAAIAKAIHTAATAAQTTATVGATAAQDALNASMAANPIGLVIAAVAALTVGLVALCASAGEATSEYAEMAAAARENADAVREQKQAYDDMKQAQVEQASADLAQIEHAQNLWRELDRLADSSGEVADKDKARANFILGELNDALGTEYTMTGNIIDNYRTLQDEIDKLIEKKKLEILQNAALPVYEKAIKDEINHRVQAERDKNDFISKQNELYNKQIELIHERQRIDKDWGGTLYAGLSVKYANLQKDISALSDAVTQSGNAWRNHANMAQSALQDKTMYEEAMVLAEEGHIDRAIAALSYYSSATNQKYREMNGNIAGQRTLLETEYQNAENALTTYLENVANGTEKFNEDTLSQLVSNVKSVYDQGTEIGANVGDGFIEGLDGSKIALFEEEDSLLENFINNAKTALDIHSPSGIFEEIGENTDLGMAKGVNARSGDVANEGTSLVKMFVARFDTLRHQMQNIGVNAINGIIEGLRSAEGRLMEKARNLANSIATTMKKALDIRSPSRVFRNQIGRNIPLGVAEGIDDEQPTVDRKVLRFGDRLVSRMQASIWAARMRNAISTDVSRMAFQAAGLNSTTNNNNYSNSQSFNFYTPTATPYEVATAARLAWEVH